MSLESNTTACKLAKAVTRVGWMSLAFEFGSPNVNSRTFSAISESC